MSFRVIFSPQARADVQRLYDFLLERAEYVEDLEVADRAVQAIEAALTALTATPFLFRKAPGARSRLRRELVVPFGGAGYVVAYEIARADCVVVLAVRHQREQDFH